MRPKKLLRTGIVAAVAWTFVVVGAYYVAHKPFTIANLHGLSLAFTGLLGATTVVVLGAGVGLFFVASKDLDGAERLIWSTAVGLGAVSLIGLALGALGLLRSWLLWALALAGLASTARKLRAALTEAWADASWRPRDAFERVLAGYCAVTLAIALIWALTPPTAWDGLVYHLTGPKIYLTAGRIAHPIDLPYLGFPQLTEILFTWAMGLAGTRAAAPIHWFYGLLSTFALVTAGRRWLRGSVGWLAAALLLSARTTVLLSGWPYVDLALLLYAVLAFQAIDLWADQRQAKWLILSGVLVGMALSTKYTALTLLPALGLAFFAFRIWREGLTAQSLRSVVLHSLILGTVALLVWAPWLAKNLMLTGNPTYPFSLLPGSHGIYWDSWRDWWYDRPGTGLAYTAPARLLTAPWDATIWGVEGGAGYSATIGPLFLALLPLPLLVRPWLAADEQRRLAAAAVFCGVLYGFWLWGVARTALLRQTRLLFPAFGILALMITAGVKGLRQVPYRSLDLGWVIRATVVAVLAITLVGELLSMVRAQPIRVLTGSESREDFLARRLGQYYTAIEHINRELSEESIVLFLWEPRSYHCEITCHPDALLDRWLHTTHLHGRNAEAIASAWRTDGITHILLHRTGLNHILEAEFDPLTAADLQAWRDLSSEHLSLVRSFGSAYDLYRLEAR